MRIDVVVDVVCPWCYLGKRQLDLALAETGQAAEVAWHPYLLDADVPAEGEKLADYLGRKYGAANLPAMWQRVRQAGDQVGLTFAFEEMRRQNSVEAHRLVRFAGTQGRAGEVLDRLFRAYFTELRTISDPAVLAEIAGEAGLDREAARRHLDAGADRDEVLGEAEAWRRAGVTGVPCYVFNGRHALPGAVGVETLRQVLGQVEAMGAEPQGAAG